MFAREDDNPRKADMQFGTFKAAPEPTLRLRDEDTDDYELSYERDDKTGLDKPDMVETWRRLMAYYQQELDIQHDQRAAMMEDERYYDGDQWDAADAAVLRGRGQQPLVYNVIAPAVNWLLGTERRTRTDHKVLPRRKDGSEAAEHKTKLLKYLDDCYHNEYNVSRAFGDAVKVGLGWLEEGYQGEGEAESVFTRYESWRNILHDTRATELDLQDARYLFRAKWVDLDVAGAFFPDRKHVLHRSTQSTSEMGDTFLDAMADEPMDELEMFADRSTYMGVIGGDGRNMRRRVRLIEAWYRKPMMSDVMKGGQFAGELFDPMSPGHFQEVITQRATVFKQVKMRVHVCVFTATGLLYNEISPYRHNRLPFTPIWGNRRAGDGMPYGLIRNMKDIQNDLNKRHSKALHILSTSKIIMDENAVDNLDELAEEAARPDGIIVKKPGKHLELNADRDMAPAHMELMSRDADMIQQQSGITDEAMGRTTNASSGKAIVARQNQGSVAVSHFLDNLRLGLKIHGEKKLSLVEQFYTEEKEFRITDTRGTGKYVQVNLPDMPTSDITLTKADFIIAEDDWKSSIRQAQVEQLMELITQIAPVAPEIALSLLDLIVDAMDIPFREQIVSRIRSITGAEDPDADPENADPEQIARQEAKAKQAAMAERAAVAELAKTEAEAREKAASADEKAARAGKTGAEMERLRSQMTSDEIGNLEGALRAALTMIQSRPAVPLADRIIAEAKAAGIPPGMPGNLPTNIAQPLPQAQ